MDAQYEFGILGPVHVVRDGRDVVVGAVQLRTVLAALLVDADRVVPVAALVDRLWGDGPPHGARNAVQNYVLRLRRALGPGVVLTDRCGYVLRVAEPGRLDVRGFASLVTEGRAAAGEGRPERAAELFDRALGLWRGEPLGDLPVERFQDVVPALHEQHLAAQEAWVDAVLACGRPADALPRLRRLTDGHPLDERFWARRMLALYRCGRQGEALECFRLVSAVLADELGIDPGAELKDLHQRMLTAAPDLVPTPRRHALLTAGDRAPSSDAPGNLPAETTSFVGREHEIDRTGRLLAQGRLVTLTGVGGVGKTRLALRTARRLAPSFPDGVWLTDLAALTDPALLERAVAESLGLRDQSMRSAGEAIVDRLHDRRLLLVLDNCEHLVGAVAALVLRLLRAAPELRVLATSRERLCVPGEHVLLVPCLTLRDGPDGTPCEAVRLLVDRSAASGAPAWADERRAAAATELCRRLDGIPLAIELAAVRLSALTVEEVLERLEDRFHLLSARHERVPGAGPPGVEPSDVRQSGVEPSSAGPSGVMAGPGRYRHTLRGVMDWSHGLCTPAERLLWSRLSVFVGGFDLVAVESVCTGGGIARAAVLDLVDGLVHKSVVTVDHGDAGRRRYGSTSRYRLLETIRQYGAERLRAEGDATGVRLRHCEYYRDLAARAAAEWCGPDEVGWLERLRMELPNVRSALDFCRADPGRAPTGAQITVDLMRTRAWFFGSTLGEARHWIESLSARFPDAAGGAGGAPAVVVTAMKTFIALVQGDPAATAYLAECRTAARADGAPQAAPVEYMTGVHGLLVLSDPASIDRLARARAEFAAGGQSGDAHMATMFWAMATAFLGGGDAARTACAAYVAEAQAAGAEWALTWAQWCTGLTELLHGDPRLALAPLCDALVRQRAVDDNWGPAWSLETLAWTLGALGRHREAVVVLGAARRHRQVTGAQLTGLHPFAALHARTRSVVREHLSAGAYADAWERGAGDGDGIALALNIAYEVGEVGEACEAEGVRVAGVRAAE
ncbi:BTAD domain-containing putative transcriptional regulator [Streptomyces sp. NPDC017979]|uniref:BTAD domain-containing putative transcriptional regulator n=1 Tax=Streptomyces sp. NPDC017979 TaxID=3365024 RepID=UPI0037A26814